MLTYLPLVVQVHLNAAHDTGISLQSFINHIIQTIWFVPLVSSTNNKRVVLCNVKKDQVSKIVA